MKLYYKMGKEYGPDQINEKKCFSGNMPLAAWCLSMRNKYNIGTVIETGTNMALTTEFFAKAFSKVYTIDIQKDFTNMAKKKFAGKENVECVSGDSSIVLDSICKKIPKDEVVLLFLDAHGNYNPGGTKTVKYFPENNWSFCPLLKELNIIRQNLYGRCLIIVDDVPFTYMNDRVGFGMINISHPELYSAVSKCFSDKCRINFSSVNIGVKIKPSLISEPADINRAIFITARLGSSRLPNKHLLKINDKYCIEHLIERVKKSKLANKIILCTTLLPEDTILCNIATQHGIGFYRGGIKDKLDRWRGAADKFDVDFFVTADADDLFCEPKLIDLCFKQYDKTKADFIEWDPGSLICGAFSYGISTAALRFVCAKKQTIDTEMMWTFFNKGCFKKEKLQNVPSVFMRPEIRATLDYEEDFEFFKQIYIYMKNKNFSLEDVVSLIDKHPEIININKHRREDWEKNQQKGLKHE
jgi:spore coat polysaccharide biosynthesis protein SpsF